MELSLHDNRLISYTVDEKVKEILLRTIYDDVRTSERIDVLFSGVSAYDFMHHALSIGTILFGIEEKNPMEILEDNWLMFEEGKKYGWPGKWSETKAQAEEYFRNQCVKGFELSSSCGLDGWILAEKVDIKKA